MNLALIALALAQPPESGDVEMPRWEHWAVMESAPQRDRLWLFGPRDVWELTEGMEAPAHIATGSFVDAVMFDLDQDWIDEPLLCGPEGVSRLEPTGELTLVLPTPCRAITALHASVPVLVVASQTLWAFDSAEDGTSFGRPLPAGPVELVAHQDRLAVRHSGGLDLWEPGGHQQLNSSIPTDGVTLGPGRQWHWSLGGELFPPSGPSFFSDARSIQSADLNADGSPGLYAIHPGSMLVGGAEDASEELAYPLEFVPRALVPADWDGDGGMDLVVLGEHELALMYASGAGPSLQIQELPFLQVPTRSIWGLPVPLFQDTNGQLSSGRTPPNRTMVGGVGWAWGGQIGGADGVGLSPTFLVTIEHGAHKPVQGFIGLDSSPLILQIGNGVFTHLAMVSGGMTLGNPHLRAGPLFSAGLLGVGAGGRAIWTPFERPSGSLHGLEWRAVAYPGLQDPQRIVTGELSLSYVRAMPMGGQGAVSRPGRAPRARQASERTTHGVCRRFGGVLGVSAGASNTRNSWDFVGRNIRLDIAATPSASGWCELATGPLSWLLSIDSAPFFRYRVPWDAGQADQAVRQMGSLTTGPVVGGDVVRAGPILVGGIWMSGIGARMQLTPIGSDSIGHHGLEARALYLVPSVGAGQVSLGYSFWMDPRQ